MIFRKLKASEIDARVATVSEKGCSLLLYKDARVDQNILDETVGCLNWQRSHQLIGDRLYCTVSIWDDKKGQWISKQDVGTESYTEKEKGQASDSFKRACFNLGIGRELYTAPFIWIPSSKCNIVEKGGKATTYDRFVVDEIGYDEVGNINRLVIRNTGSAFGKRNDIVYQLGAPVTEEQKAEVKYDGVRAQKISKTDVTALKKKYPSEEQVKNIFSHFGIDKWEDMTIEQYTELIKTMKGDSK